MNETLLVGFRVKGPLERVTLLITLLIKVN